MLCNVIKVSHPLLVNHSDGGVKLSVHHWQSDALAAASYTLDITFFSEMESPAQLERLYSAVCVLSWLERAKTV